jgi:hypothetical protein
MPNSASDLDSLSPNPGFMTKNWKKFTANKIFFYFFKSKIAIYLSLGLQKGCPSYSGSQSILVAAMKDGRLFQMYSGSQ